MKRFKEILEESLINEKDNNDWAIVVDREYMDKKKGDVLFENLTYKQAEKKCKQSGRDTFLSIKNMSEL